MAIINSKKYKLREFFEFSSGLQHKFDLVDMMSDPKDPRGEKFLDDKGLYLYQANFIVNVQRAAKMNVAGLRFEIFKKDPEKYPKSSNTRDALDAFEIKFEIPKYTIEEQGTATRDKESRVRVEENSRIKVVADNRTASAVGKRMDIVVPEHRQETDFKTACHHARNNGQDPAGLASAGRYSSIDVKQSVSLGTQNNRSHLNNDRIQSSSRNSGNKTSLRDTRDSLRQKRQGRQDNRVVRAVEKEKKAGKKPSQVSYFDFLPIKKEYKHIFELSASIFRDLEVFYVRISAIKEREDNQEFQNVYCKVRHEAQIDEFLSHPHPPDLKIMGVKAGNVTLRLERKDPTLRKVHLFRIITNPNFVRPITQDVGFVSFTTDNYIDFRDDGIDNVYPNKITYRACVVNGDGTISEFTSIVVPSIRKVSDPTNTAATPVSIRAINTLAGVEVTVDTLSKNILSFRLLRQEINKSSTFGESVTEVISDSRLVFQNQGTSLIGLSAITEVANQRSSFRILDEGTVLGRKYRYFLAYRLGFEGSIQKSEETISDEDETIVRVFPYMQVPFNISLSSPNVSVDSNNVPTVSFTINVEETKELYNTVIKALQTAGIGQEFIKNLEEDITKSKNILTFSVERYNVETGRRDSYGIFPPGEFTDSQTIRQTRNIADPFPGARYVYIVKTCLQSPEIFLQNGVVGLITSSGQEIKKKAARFSRLIYTRLGVMPPETDVRNGKDIEQLILESQVGIEKTAVVDMPNTQPTIADKIIEQKTHYTKIKWRVAGDNRAISYFQIFGENNTQEMLLGAVACPNSCDIFSFNDYRMVDEIGKVNYRIKAIGYEDDEIVNSKIEKQTITSMSVPDNLLTGYLYGEVGGVKMSLFINNAEELANMQKAQQSLAARGHDISLKSMMAYKYHRTQRSSPSDPEVVSVDAEKYWEGIDLPTFGKPGFAKSSSARTRDDRNVFGDVNLSSVYHTGFKQSLDQKGVTFTNKYEASMETSKSKVQNLLGESAVSDDGNIETFSNTSLLNILG